MFHGSETTAIQGQRQTRDIPRSRIKHHQGDRAISAMAVPRRSGIGEKSGVAMFAYGH